MEDLSHVFDEVPEDFLHGYESEEVPVAENLDSVAVTCLVEYFHFLRSWAVSIVEGWARRHTMLELRLVAEYTLDKLRELTVICRRTRDSLDVLKLLTLASMYGYLVRRVLQSRADGNLYISSREIRFMRECMSSYARLRSWCRHTLLSFVELGDPVLFAYISQRPFFMSLQFDY